MDPDGRADAERLRALEERLVRLEAAIESLSLELEREARERWRKATAMPLRSPAELVRLQDAGQASPQGSPVPIDRKSELLHELSAHLVAPPPPPPEAPECPLIAAPPTSPPAAPAPIVSLVRPLPADPEEGRYEASGFELERFLGARVAAWIGAIVVLVGVGFFLQYAWSQGWLQRFPPAGRLVLAYAFGAGLIAAAEWTARRFGRAAAVGLVAAGVGTFYVATLAAFWPLRVFSANTSLLVATIVAILSMLLVLRVRMLTAGAVSLAGGYLAPLILGLVEVPGLLVPTHLTVVLAIGLGLSFLDAPVMRPLRYVAIGLHAAVALLWYSTIGAAAGPVLLVFAGGWWVMATGEALVATLRGQSPRGNAVAMVAVSALAAMASVVGAAAPTRWSDPNSYLALALAAASLLIAFQFTGGLAPLRDRPEGGAEDATSDEERSIVEATRHAGTALVLQSGGLFVAGVAVFLREGGLAATWSAFAVLSIVLGTRLPSATIRALGVIVLSLATMLTTVLLALGTGGPGAEEAFGWAFDPVSSWGSLVALLAAYVVLAHAFAAAGEPERGDGVPRVRPRTEFASLLVPLVACGAVAIWLLGSGRSAGWALAATATVVPALWLAFAFLRRHGLWPLVAGTVVLALGWLVWVTADLVAGERRLAIPLMELPPIALAAAGLVLAGLVPTPRIGDGVRSGSLVSLLVALALLFGDIFREAAAVGDAVVRAIGLLTPIALGGAAMAAIGTRQGWRSTVVAGAGCVFIAAIGWIGPVLLNQRIEYGPTFGTPLLLQGALGCLLFASTWVAIAVVRRWATFDTEPTTFEGLDLMLSLVRWAIPVVFGTVVLDGLLDVGRSGSAADATMKLAAISVWWGMYSIGLLALGFARRRPPMRYVGLAGLGIVAVKVLVVDMSAVATIWRVVALLVTGLALVGTSVLYVRLGKVLASRN